jgi:hypothetical protein
MVPSTNATYPAGSGWWQVAVAGNDVTWVLTNGQGQWDNNGCAPRASSLSTLPSTHLYHTPGLVPPPLPPPPPSCVPRRGKNYEVAAPGVYAQMTGQVPAAVATFPVGCPAACVAPAGSCTQPGTVCVCNEGYYGWDCGAQCNCDGHGSCDGGGDCICDHGWASCNGTDNCSTSVSNDPYNCGGCGVTCLPDPSHGVANATCANATCTVVCGAGYTLCPDGTCHLGSDCPLPGCDTYSDNQCSGNETDTPAIYANRTWQTPAPGSPGYYASFQSYHTLVGYARLTYDPTHTVVNITVVVQQKTPAALTFSFNNVTQTSATATFCATAGAAPGCTVSNGPVWVVVTGSDGSRLQLDEVYLLWGAAPLAPRQGDYRNGQKGALVELFGWPFADVAAECADLAAFGYMGARLYPVTEHIFSWQPFQ